MFSVYYQSHTISAPLASNSYALHISPQQKSHDLNFINPKFVLLKSQALQINAVLTRLKICMTMDLLKTCYLCLSFDDYKYAHPYVYIRTQNIVYRHMFALRSLSTSHPRNDQEILASKMPSFQSLITVICTYSEKYSLNFMSITKSMKVCISSFQLQVPILQWYMLSLCLTN